MKLKHYLITPMLLGLGASTMYGQIGIGGLPKSFNNSTSLTSIPDNEYELPDWKIEHAKLSKEQSHLEGALNPYYVGLLKDASVGFPYSGTFTTQADGSQIWIAKVKVKGAPSISFYYDNFNLPVGVTLYIYNANKKQVIGGFTNSNNSEDNLFSSQEVQGDEATIELNIDKDVDIKDINMHINKLGLLFEGISYLKQYANTPTFSNDENHTIGITDPYGFEGSGSLCNINAICSQGENYSNQRRATLQVLMPSGSGIGMCSGTMINSVGNTSSSCVPYVLFASHCNASNGVNNSAFSQFQFRYNFESSTCEFTDSAKIDVITGANYVARSVYPTQGSTIAIPGDFLMLKLRQAVPASYNVYFAGWDNNASHTLTATSPQKFIGFHHPAGDIKKLLTTQSISPNGSVQLIAGSHWLINPIAVGGAEGGSSGSGLFDADGRLIGIASVAGNPNPDCTLTGSNDNDANFYRYVQYAKFSLAWNYSYDGTSNTNKLQPWLDPQNTGITSLDGMENCANNATGIKDVENDALNNGISIYPNPVKDGEINLKLNLSKAENLNITLVSINGAKIANYNLNNVKSGNYKLNLGSGIASGMYLLKINSSVAVATKKVIISK